MRRRAAAAPGASPLPHPAGRYFDPELAKGWLGQLRGMVSSMVRITVTPEWVGLLDFQTRFPSALAG